VQQRGLTNSTTLNDPHVRENHRMINYPSLSNVIAAWGHISLIWSIDSKRGSRKFHYMYTYIVHTQSLFLWRYKKVKRMYTTEYKLTKYNYYNYLWHNIKINFLCYIIIIQLLDKYYHKKYYYKKTKDLW